MRHLSPAFCKAMHYLPANNMAAALLMGGPDVARSSMKQFVKEAPQTNTGNDALCPVCFEALMSWFAQSCEWVLHEQACGRKVATGYPALQPPSHDPPIARHTESGEAL